MINIKDKTIFVFIIIASFLIYIPYIQSFDLYKKCRHYTSGDSWWYEQVIHSIIQDQDLNMANNIEEKAHVENQLAMSSKGYLAPKHSILFPIVTIPFYLLFGGIGTMYFNLLLIISLNVLVYAINRMFFNKNVSLITTFLFATGTILMNYSYNYLAESFSTVLLALSILLTLKRKYYLAAIIFGFTCFVKVSNVPWIGIMFLYILWDFMKNQISWKKKETIVKCVKQYGAIVIIFFISLIPLFSTNYFLYDNFLVTGYQRVVSLDENFDLLIINWTNGFNQDFWPGLYNLLFNPTLGIIEANPIIIVSIIGVFMMKRITTKPWAIMLLFIIIGQFALFSKWDMWYATEFGNRFLMFSIILFSPFTSNLIDILINKLSKNPQISKD